MDNDTEALENWKREFHVCNVPNGLFTYGSVEWIYENNPENAALIAKVDKTKVWTLLWVEDKFLNPGFIQDGESNAMVSGWAVTSKPASIEDQLVITGSTPRSEQGRCSDCISKFVNLTLIQIISSKYLQNTALRCG